MRYFPLLIIIPLTDLFLLVRLAGIIGFLPTVLLVLGTAGIGLNLAKQQGVKVILDLQRTLAHGGVPGREIVEAVLLAVSAVLLLTPGIVTDIAGFTLLVPSLRKKSARWILETFRDGGPFSGSEKSHTKKDSDESAEYEILD